MKAIKKLLRPVIKDGWDLLSNEEKRRGAVLVVAIVLAGLLDMAAFSSVIPLVDLVIDPGQPQSQRIFHIAYQLIGESDSRLVIIGYSTISLTFLILSTVSRLGLQLGITRYGAKCQARLAREIVEMIVSAPYEWFLSRNSAELTRTIYADLNVWASSFVRTLLDTGNALFTIGIAVLLVTILARAVGLLVVALIGCLSIGFLVLVRPKIKRFADEKRRRSNEVMAKTIQTILGIKDIKLSSRETFFTTALEDATRGIAYAMAGSTYWGGLPPVVMVMLGQILLVGIVFALWSVGASAAEIAGQVALLLLVSSRLVPALNQFSAGLSRLWDSTPFVQNVATLRQSLVEVIAQYKPKESLSLPIQNWRKISLRNIGFNYRADNASILSSIDADIERGKSYGIVGPSGAGKSTLVDLVLGLLRPTSGQIAVDDRSYEEIDIKSWQRHLAYVPQEPFLLDDTLRANVAFGIPREKVDDERVMRCLELANLTPLVQSLKLRLDTPLYERGKRFSGGERQRIAIARALYNEPELLVLDEATSALDAANEAMVRVAIENLKGRVTTLVIAHRLGATQNCDVIFVLDRGRLVANGTYETLLASNALFRRLAYSPSNPKLLAPQLGDQHAL